MNTTPRYCSACSAVLAPDADRCRICGSAVTAEAAPQLQAGVPPPEPLPPANPGARRPLVLLAGLLLAGLIGLLLYAGTFLPNERSGVAETTTASAVAPAAAAENGAGGMVADAMPGGAAEQAAATARVATMVAVRTAEVATATAAAERAAEQATATVIAAATATMQAYFESGTQIFRDEFVDNRHNWFTGRFNDAETNRIEGEVFKVIWDKRGTSYELYDVRSLTSFIAEVDCVIYQGERDGSCGLVFGHNSDAGFYKFEVFNDYYRLFVIKAATEPRLLLEGDPQGIGMPNNANRLRVIRQGEFIRIYLNQTLLNSVADSTFLSGKLGVSTNSYRDGPGVEIWFDNFTIWALP
jgi:hypothetical protein